MTHTPQSFLALINWIDEHTDATRSEAIAIAVKIGDSPELDDDDNWIATVNGKKWVVPPMFHVEVPRRKG